MTTFQPPVGGAQPADLLSCPAKGENKTKTVIDVSNLSKSFGANKAVDNLSFSVPEGSLFAFLGQNGAGKSTTINMLIGLLQRDGGDVRYGAGEDFPAFRQKIGVVFQDNVFDALLTVTENLELYAALTLEGGATVKTRPAELISLLDMGDYAKNRVKNLSGGQKRKAEIARALLCAPKVLFLDEPTTGLDPRTRAEVWNILRDIRQKTGMTVFLTTHYMEEAAGADRVVIIHRGKLLAEGSPAELKARYSQDRLLITPRDAAALEKGLNQRDLGFQKVADTYAVPIDDTEASIELLNALKANILFFEAQRGSMDDVFLNAVGERIGEEAAHA
ncbi:MAG: ABC transporter ATP-binding protein [Firmicutes bacterium]|nr:ABC transporter ATP-binding protein [Bacillota bacterium]